MKQNNLNSRKPLPHILSGKVSSDHLIIFMHGFPDNTSLWKKITPYFENDYLILNVSYPNNSPEEKNKWGITFEEIVERLKITIDFVNKDKKRKNNFVVHDWGAFYAFLFSAKYPEYIDDMLVIDVTYKHKFTFQHVMYQWPLIMAFLIGGRIGTFMTKFVIKRIVHYNPEDWNLINSSINYSYYYLWKNLSSIKKSFTNFVPKYSISYVYGNKKPFMFHTESFLKQLPTLNKDNEIHSLNTGHWVMKEKPGHIIDILKKRIQIVAQRPKF